MDEPLIEEVAAEPPPYRSAVLAGVAALALYVVTLAPTTAFWDTSEYIATAHILGIPHPPGNPLFVFVGRVWSLLLSPLGLPVAVRINLLAATTSAAATGFFYLIAHRVLSGFFQSRRPAELGAAASAMLGATAFTVWNQSNVNEKVYTLSVLIIAVVSWLAVRWRDRRYEPGSLRYLLWAVFLLALGSTNHLMSVLPAPALAAFLLMSGPRRVLNGACVGRAALLIALGLSFNFVLPVRAEQDPVINEGDPTCESALGAAGAIYGNVLPGPLRRIVPLPECPMLADNLARVQYQTPPLTQRNAPFGAQLEMYWQYFDWQWSRGIDSLETPSRARRPFTLLFLALGLVGLWAAWRSDKAIFVYLSVLAATLTVALVAYLNFRYGYSLSPEIADAARHEVRERDYFYVAGFLLWGCLAGIGLSWTWHALSALGEGGARYARASPLLLVAAIPLALNWSWASRAGDHAARDWAYDLIMSVEPYGVLFTSGDNDTFPLWFLQEVEGVRRDVTVIVGQYLLTDWYPKQLKQLSSPGNQRPFDGSPVPGLFADRQPPAASITSMTEEEMDAVGSARLADALTIAFPALAVTYPAETVLGRAQQLALRIIHDSAIERPIFFASTAGLLTELGLAPWGVRHGLAVKLELRSLDAEPEPGLVRGSERYGGNWFDVPRSMRLYDEVYLYRGIRDREIWQDRSTINIPLWFYALALQLSDAVEAAGGDAEVVRRLQEHARAFQRVTQRGSGGAAGL